MTTINKEKLMAQAIELHEKLIAKGVPFEGTVPELYYEMSCFEDNKREFKKEKKDS